MLRSRHRTLGLRLLGCGDRPAVGTFMLMATEQGFAIPTQRSTHLAALGRSYLFTPLRFAENLVATVLFGLIIVLAQALGIDKDGNVMAAEKRRRSRGSEDRLDA
jgi:hypothetical protein